MQQNSFLGMPNEDRKKMAIDDLANNILMQLQAIIICYEGYTKRRGSCGTFLSVFQPPLLIHSSFHFF